MFSDSDRKFQKYSNKLFSNIKILIKNLLVIFLKNEMHFQKIAFRISGHVSFAQTNTLKKVFSKFSQVIFGAWARAWSKKYFFQKLCLFVMITQKTKFWNITKYIKSYKFSKKIANFGKNTLLRISLKNIGKCMGLKWKWSGFRLSKCQSLHAWSKSDWWILHTTVQYSYYLLPLLLVFQTRFHTNFGSYISLEKTLIFNFLRLPLFFWIESSIVFKKFINFF